MGDRVYLLPETDEAKAKLRAWFDLRAEIIRENSKDIKNRVGDIYADKYSTNFSDKVSSIGFKTHPGSDWTDRNCPDGCYRPKRSTADGKDLLQWMSKLRVVPTERDFLGFEYRDSPYNKIQIIGHYQEGPTCLVVPKKCEERPDGFREISKKRWDLVLAQHAVEQEDAV